MAENERQLTVSAPVIDVTTDPVQGDAPPADPAALAASWLPEPDEDRMPMTLSTIDEDGYPRARTVLLTEFDGERLYFHTDAESRKVADLAANPRVALTLLWPAFTRQMVVQGIAERAGDAEIARAYELRSPYLRQLAWQNTADFAARSLAEREAEWARFRAAHPKPEQPAGWVGFAVRPHRYLFWTSHPDAASRRLEFVRSADGWTRHLLAG
ncbi:MULTISPECIES: pyridoxine/pyridoxamine 5'-phosphate oxidase [Microbacterium]|uniref:Pyridoxamine 5-phosphate oxidase n=1 Tax=Microbacterium wangchenii TaxID=2541726 RepID=A0ABX5SPB2_9MICO|nr:MULTISPECIES: pyridoxamine 5'-phosphate oxidase family protein [Microbacterium]MCK6066655.1 pyridoxamine 5'-phosphate oxidase family protein [Microbacterium sp. EYE_512]QBR87986.1 pyridoxamine 5-phosphate oxidase [Microbacterium wangchenii]TXK18224.1 pyridoxamine 5-phosphate oxidase [Microbacterium wangchenii]